MIAPLKNVLCLHASSADLKFLNPVRNRMAKLLGKQFRLFELTNQHSNADAMLAVRKAESGFIIFFAHGSEDYLRGGEYRSRLEGENVEIERFLTRKDLSSLKGKVVFCMSCDSNGLAYSCLFTGALAFVGFDEIPFNRFNAGGEPIGSHVLIKHSQELIAEAIQAAMELFLTGRATLDEAVDFLQLWISKKAINYVRANKSVKEARDVAALFLRVKQGVKYHGPKGIRFEMIPE